MIEPIKAAVYAHRGVHDNRTVYENTLESVRLASELGVGAEIDVRLTSDGVCVLHHDPRTYLGERISRMSYGELRHYRLPDGSAIPTLSEVLHSFGGKLALLIEIKSTGLSSAIAEKTWEAIREHTDGITVQSFDPLMLRRFKRLSGGAVPCGLLSAAYALSDGIIQHMHGRLVFSSFSRADFISYRSDVAAQSRLERLRRKKSHFGLWSALPEHAAENRDNADFYICDIEPRELKGDD